MVMIEKTKLDAEKHFERLVGKRHTGQFNCFSELTINKKYLGVYQDWLEECEELGFEYFLILIDEDDENNMLCGFSNFELIDYYDSFSVNYSIPYSDNEVLKDLFFFHLERGSHFLISERARFFRKLIIKIGERLSNNISSKD